MTFPVARPETYDPDKSWDEETGTWVSGYTDGAGNRVEFIVAVGEHGGIYFNQVT